MYSYSVVLKIGTNLERECCTSSDLMSPRQSHQRRGARLRTGTGWEKLAE